MTDMNEATAHGVRELKALLSAALIIAQARERTREHELRQQEREMAERERQAWRGTHHDPTASPTGTDPNSLLTQPDPARQERELERWVRFANAARTSNGTAERDDEYAATAASAAQSTQTPAAQLDLAEKWANAHADPDTGPLYRAELDNQVRARGVDPAKILLPPPEGQQPSGQSFTPTIIDPEQVRQDADIRAGELERDPDTRRLEAETTREQALGEVAAHQDDAAEIQAAEHPNGAWQGGGPAAQLAGKAYSTDPSAAIPARLGTSRKQPITNRDQARTQSRER
jgi:hypothetical protein